MSARCLAHPAFEADYCPLCGTARVIDVGVLTLRTPPRVVASSRSEREACERGTVGCCVDHTRDAIDSCETW